MINMKEDIFMGQYQQKTPEFLIEYVSESAIFYKTILLQQNYTAPLRVENRPMIQILIL